MPRVFKVDLCKGKELDRCNDEVCTWVNGANRKYCRTRRIKRQKSPRPCKNHSQRNCLPRNNCRWISQSSRSRAHCKSRSRRELPNLTSPI